MAFEWSDIPIYLAVASEGSTLGASRKLNLNQTTVSRRIQALEHALKLTLFERDTRGYALTPHGTALLDVAGQMNAAAENVALRAERLRREISGTIRISAASQAFEHLGFPLLTKFRERYPDVTFEADTDDRVVSLERGEADIALRAADEVVGDTLIARKLATIPWGIYCSRGYLTNNGIPRDIDDCATHGFLQYDDDLVSKIKGLRWLRDRISKEQIVYVVNTVPGMTGSLKTGSGLGALPCMAGDAVPDLVCCFRQKEMSHTLWIVASKESYAHARVRAFMKAAGENFPHDVLWEEPS